MDLNCEGYRAGILLWLRWDYIKHAEIVTQSYMVAQYTDRRDRGRKQLCNLYAQSCAPPI